MRYLKLTITYDGADYVGWQVQDNGVSVQEKLEAAWKQVTGESLRITASGRTDSGVHARGQVCSVKTNSDLPCDRLRYALTATTPFDISVLSVVPAPDGFHAIRDATSKTYRYQIQHGRILDVLNRHHYWFIPRKLDTDAMQQAANLLCGTHDFESFQATGAERLTTIRTISQLDIIAYQKGDFQYFDVVISADGFLYNMVRNIVGTLIRVGTGRKSPEWVLEVLAQNDRKAAGQTAPAHGLFLEQVRYDNLTWPTNNGDGNQ